MTDNLAARCAMCDHPRDWHGVNVCMGDCWCPEYTTPLGAEPGAGQASPDSAPNDPSRICPCGKRYGDHVWPETTR